MRGWCAIAILSGSWLLGLGYFQPASPLGWLFLVAAGAVLLSEIPLRLPERRAATSAILMVVPAGFIVPFPYKAIPVLLGLGVLLCHTPIPRRWPRRLGRGMMATSGVLFAQSAVLWCYQLCTARGTSCRGRWSACRIWQHACSESTRLATGQVWPFAAPFLRIASLLHGNCCSIRQRCVLSSVG